MVSKDQILVKKFETFFKGDKKSGLIYFLTLIADK